MHKLQGPQRFSGSIYNIAMTVVIKFYEFN